MKLTEADKDKLLRAFYRDKLLPLAAVAKRDRVEFFPLAPDCTESSYYQDRGHSEYYLHEIDPGDTANQLRELWGSGDLPALAGIADALIELAAFLQDDEPHFHDVSPFIYTMF